MQKKKNKTKSKIYDADTCFKKILQLIKYKERCSFELYNRLVINDNFSEHDFNIALGKAREFYLIDDIGYAEHYIESSLYSNKGSCSIIKHLDNMHIDYKLDQQLNDLIMHAQDTDYCRALNYIKEHKTSSKNPRQAYLRSLLRKGYPLECAKTAINKFLKDKIYLVN